MWDEAVDELTKYVTAVGHARPPATHKTESGYPLGQWVASRRKGKKKLTLDQISQLESLTGWRWNLKKS